MSMYTSAENAITGNNVITGETIFLHSFLIYVWRPLWRSYISHPYLSKESRVCVCVSVHLLSPVTQTHTLFYPNPYMRQVLSLATHHLTHQYTLYCIVLSHFIILLSSPLPLTPFYSLGNSIPPAKPERRRCTLPVLSRCTRQNSISLCPPTSSFSLSPFTTLFFFI